MSENPEKPLREYQLIGPSEDGQINDLLSDLDPARARQRLQAVIAEWLRMENLVILAAAGTSVNSGGKTMAQLEQAVLATLRALPDISSSIAAVIEDRERQSAGTSKGVNFEDWLSYLASAGFIGLIPNSPFLGVQWRGAAQPSQEELGWMVKKISDSIFAECSLTIPATDSGVASHLAFLAKVISRDSNLGRAHLFTLNYDTLFEQAIELLGIQYFDGFSGRADARFDPSVYGLDIYYPGEVAEGRVRRFDKFLHLYKLHGSVHWQLRDGELRSRHPDLQKFAGYQQLNPKEKAEKLQSFGNDLPTVGILPTANKFAQTLTMPYAHLFRSFQIRLGSSQTFLLVLGYGFNDDHITRIIETALMNPSLIMLVVEPNPKSPTIERIKHYKDLGKRAFVLTSSSAAFGKHGIKFAAFDDFARSVMPDVRWLDDFLRLRRFEKQIQKNDSPRDDETVPKA